MSKENGWKEERAFYIEYGCIELTDERSGKQISDCNMIDADWSIPWLRFRIPPKIQALIEERDALKKDNEQLKSDFIALEQAHENLIDGINNQKMVDIVSKNLKDSLKEAEQMFPSSGDTLSNLPSGLTNKDLWKPLSVLQSLKIEVPALDQDHHLQSFINASNNPDFPKDPALGDIIYIINAGTISGVKVNEGDALYYTGTGATGWVLEQRANQAETVKEEINILDAQQADAKLEALFDQYACAALTGLWAANIDENWDCEDIAQLSFSQATQSITKRADALEKLKEELGND